ncbi:MAG: flagellar biosynthesis protein FlhB [Oscillospiraceae bacterium]|nr:flagellar biosynthesis protein FlhB [Oscillospiraceae bacterium]
MADDSKTEKATPKKRRDERKKGNVFLSRDAVSVATLLGSYAVLWATAGGFAEQLGGFMSYCLQTGSTLRTDQFQGALPELLLQGLLVVLKTVGPVLAVTLLCAVAATFAQTRFLVATESLKPKFNRISPLQGFKRLFSLKSVIEALKGILKISILMVIVYLSIRDMFLESSRYLYVDLGVSAAHLVEYAAGMVVRIAIAFVALAAMDFLYQWWDYERQLKMSKQEVKEEYKQMEGDPQVKGKIKQIQRQRAQQRMMQQVPGADVVIRNPTHYAVALRYKPDQDDAPVVLAKGQDSLALRIVQIAEEHHIAVMENVPLARALYAGTEVNREIPPEFYGAVAEVLVYIFRLNNKKQIVK